MIFSETNGLNRSIVCSSLLRAMMFLMACIVPAFCQDAADVSSGVNPYGIYQGGQIDNVSLSTLRLHLNVPLLEDHSQRGKLNFTYSLSYSSTSWLLVPSTRSGVNGYWYPASSRCLGGLIDQGRIQSVGLSSDGWVTGSVVTKHNSDNDLITFGIVSESDGACHYLGSISPTSWQALDGSGYHFDKNTVILTNRDGIQFNVGTDTATDPNGNVMTGGITALTDTLGRSWTTTPSDVSSCPVTAAAANIWQIPGPAGTTRSFKFCYSNIPIATHFNHALINEYTGTASLLTGVVLPNGTFWRFDYNDSYGDLTTIYLPTGGTISYAWTTTTNPFCGEAYTYARYVTSRTVFDGTTSQTWLYGTTVTDPLGNDIAVVGSCADQPKSVTYYVGPKSNNNVIKTETIAYLAMPNPYPRDMLGYFAGYGLPTSKTITWANGETSRVTYSYDPGFSFTDYNYGGNIVYNTVYGLVASENDYDYGNGAPSAQPIKTTTTTYKFADTAAYLNNNLLTLPEQVATFVGTGAGGACGTNGATECTTFGYDESSLQPSNVTEQHGPGESSPGNQTSVHRWLNVNSAGTPNCPASTGYLVSSKVYYDTGEVQQSTDPCGNSTSSTYSSTYYGAYPTVESNALNQQTLYGYDFNTGLVTSVEDPNLQITTKQYDNMLRLTQENYPDHGSKSSCYTDNGGAACTKSGPPYAEIQTEAIRQSVNKVTTDTFDVLGRISETTLNTDPDGATTTLTQYDPLGRESKVYNPSRCPQPGTNCGTESTWGYTTYNYDPLNRVTSMLEPDGASATTDSYAAFPCATVTDEAGKARKTCVDGLGRLTGVWEDPAGLNYETDYFYDALSNLICVQQRGGVSTPSGTGCAYSSSGDSSSPWRIRRFQYDSASRLIQANNPESGPISYSYDANGNLITKVSPRPNQTNVTVVETTSYTYDVLNRLTQKSYAGLASPTIKYWYDGGVASGCTTAPPGIPNTPPYLIGHRTAMCDGSGASSWSYDPMGRVLAEARTTVSGGNHTASTQYSYNLDGSLQSLRYPSNQTVVNFTVSGAGRPTAAIDATFGVNYVTNASYAPNGALSSYVVGQAINGLVTYNNRLQPLQMFYGTNNTTLSTLQSNSCPGTVGNIMHRVYNFAAGSADNGNVISITNCRDTNRTQGFSYDSLNRVASAATQGTTCSYCWGQLFGHMSGSQYVSGYDSWGNLHEITATQGTPTTLSMTVLSNNNRFSGVTYNADGALKNDGIGDAYTYSDGEGRLTNAGGITYSYDGDGQRVKKSGLTLYWRSTSSEVLAESSSSGVFSEEYVFFGGKRIARRDTSTGAVNYYYSDHLGSASAISSASGVVQEESDYYPFGGEILVNGSDPNHYKFTGKERDSESKLDYFGARHYASSFGRFMTPDWATKPAAVPYADFGDPRSLNLYGYVKNNPTTTADRDGHLVGADDAVIGGIIVTYMVIEYLASPQGQQMLQGVGNAIVGMGGAAQEKISGLLHPDNSGGNVSPPSSTPTPNTPQNPPPSESQQGTVDSSPAAMAGGPKAANAPGITAGGQATNEFGQKTGPSGRSQIDETNSNTRERGRNRALSGGGGAAEDATPHRGSPHWHSTNSKGEKSRNGAHHNYSGGSKKGTQPKSQSGSQSNTQTPPPPPKKNPGFESQ